MSDDNNHNEGGIDFSKEYEGMWYLLGIPTIMIVGTVIVGKVFQHLN